MFTWVRKPDGWYADRYRIECMAPHTFVLVDATTAPSGPVRIDTPPLASATTLKGCKREAEVVAAALRRSDLRRKHLSILLLATATGVLSGGAGFPSNFLAISVCAYLALRSIAVVVGSFLWRYEHNASDGLYQ